MLHCVYSKQADRWGVLDDEKSQLIIPFSYTRITLQKYGIIAYDDNGMGVVFLQDGTPAVRAMKNVLLLDNHTLLTSRDDETCYIVDYAKRDYLCKLKLDSILFFWGSRDRAEEYTAKKDLSDIFAKADYWKHGAHLENLVGVRSKQTKLWGVYNLNTLSLYSGFNYQLIVQCTGQRIGGITTDGTHKMQI